MTLPGLLIEYLVSGALALPWLIVISGLNVNREVPNWQLPLLAVALYVMGMMIDLIAFVLLKPLKWRLRKRIAKRLGIEHKSAVGSAAARLVRLMKYSPEIAREVSARSSRDRIARGVVINAALTVVVLWQFVSWWFAALICLATLGMWLFFEANSYVFELRADEAIRRENEIAGVSKSPDTKLQPASGD
jgi:hypothetical protein